MTDDQRSDDGEGVAEHEVRAMLHRAVAQVQPDPAALPRLRRAVPRRRARHRTMWTGVAAAGLLTAVVVPTMHSADRVFLSDSSANGRTLAETDGTGTADPDGDSATARSHAPRPVGSLPGGGGSAVTPGAPTVTPSTGVSSTGVGTATAVPAGTSDGSVPPPPCVRADLGQANSYLAPADSSGKVYGWFTVLNTSGHSCALTGAGTLQIAAVGGGTDPARVKVVDHQAGDPATGLPDPATAPHSLVLQPSAGYEVQFGWVPDSACPAPSGTPAASSSASPAAAGPAPSGTASPGPGLAGGTSTPTPNLSAAPSGGSPPPGTTPSITLVHTPQAGAPAAASAVVNGACAGTVYRAAPQAVTAASPAGTPSAGG